MADQYRGLDSYAYHSLEDTGSCKLPAWRSRKDIHKEGSNSAQFEACMTIQIRKRNPKTIGLCARLISSNIELDNHCFQVLQYYKENIEELNRKFPYFQYQQRELFNIQCSIEMENAIWKKSGKYEQEISKVVRDPYKPQRERWNKECHKVRLVLYKFSSKGQRLYYIVQAKSWGRNKERECEFGLVGGKIEPKDILNRYIQEPNINPIPAALLDALNREIKEEAQLELNPRYIHVHHFKDHRCEYVFDAQLPTNQTPVIAKDEFADAQWKTLPEIQEMDSNYIFKDVALYFVKSLTTHLPGDLTKDVNTKWSTKVRQMLSNSWRKRW